MTMAQARGSSEVYSFLAKELDLVHEQLREFYAEDEDVWIFLPGDVQPVRAKVLEDTPLENDDILIESRSD